MRVVAAVARKGGSGKSTLVKALASAALAGGKTVLMIDTDPQADLAVWFGRAKASGMAPGDVRFLTVSSTTQLDAAIDEAYQGGKTDFVFIDTAGQGGAWADQIAMMSDYLVTPVVATLTDFAVGTQTVDWFKGLHSRVERPEDLPPHRVVITNFPSKPSKRELALLHQSAGMFPVINNVVQRRNAYHEMDARGFLGEILRSIQDDPNPLQRSQARNYLEALVEATDVLNDIIGR
jgi:chromosome partitioning protein